MQLGTYKANFLLSAVANLIPICGTRFIIPQHSPPNRPNQRPKFANINWLILTSKLRMPFHSNPHKPLAPTPLAITSTTTTAHDDDDRIMSPDLASTKSMFSRPNSKCFDSCNPKSVANQPNAPFSTILSGHKAIFLRK